MSKALRFTKSEMNNAALVSREHGVIVKMARDGSLLLFPTAHNMPSIDDTDENDLDAELRAFEAKHGFG